MNTAGGYWFCSHCDDTVTLPAPVGHGDAWRCNVACPVCHHFTADWKLTPQPAKTPDVPTPEEAKELFGKIYDQIKHLPKP